MLELLHIENIAIFDYNIIEVERRVLPSPANNLL